MNFRVNTHSKIYRKLFVYLTRIKHKSYVKYYRWALSSIFLINVIFVKYNTILSRTQSRRTHQSRMTTTHILIWHFLAVKQIRVFCQGWLFLVTLMLFLLRLVEFILSKWELLLYSALFLCIWAAGVCLFSLEMWVRRDAGSV